MTECINAAVRDVTQAVCSSGESKAAKRSRRAADAAREFVQDVAEHQTDSEDDEDARPSKAKVAKKAPAACAGGGGGRCKLPRPEGTAICPRCNSDNTKFCYYNNYNIKQPRYLCKVPSRTVSAVAGAPMLTPLSKASQPLTFRCIFMNRRHPHAVYCCLQGCQRYWTEGGMLRNVAVGSGRRKSKNTQAREAEKAATADAAKQQSMIATGAFDTFQQMLMNPSLAYSASGLGANAAAAAAAAGPVSGFGGAVMTGMTPLPSMMAQPGSFSGFPGAAGVPGFANYPPAKPTDSGRMTATSDPAITALLGGPPTVTTSTVTTFSGRPAAVELKVRDAGDARVKPTDSGAASGPSEAAAALVHGGASPTAAVVGGGLMYGAGGMAGPHSGFQPDWVTAAGQMQVRAVREPLLFLKEGLAEGQSFAVDKEHSFSPTFALEMHSACTMGTGVKHRACPSWAVFPRELQCSYCAVSIHRSRSSSCSRRRPCRHKRTCERRPSAWGSSRIRICRACGPTTPTQPGPVGRPPLTHGALYATRMRPALLPRSAVEVEGLC